MSKIDISIKVNDYKIKTQGIKREHIISCIDNNDKKTKVTINTKELALTRENNELIIKIDFKNKNIRYYLKDHNKTATSPIKINEIKKEESSIKIDYINENKRFNLEIDYK